MWESIEQAKKKKKNVHFDESRLLPYLIIVGLAHRPLLHIIIIIIYLLLYRVRGQSRKVYFLSSAWVSQCTPAGQVYIVYTGWSVYLCTQMAYWRLVSFPWIRARQTNLSDQPRVLMYYDRGRMYAYPVWEYPHILANAPRHKAHY